MIEAAESMEKGECTLNLADYLYSRDIMHAAAAKGMPVEGLLEPQLKHGITYTITQQPDGTIHVRWEPTPNDQLSDRHE